MSCKSCGADLPTKAKFCQECGLSTDSISGANKPDESFDKSTIQGIKTLIKLLKKFNKDIDPREHNDLLNMVVELDVMERVTEVAQAVEVIEHLQDDDDAIAKLLAAYPDLDRDFRIYNQTVKVVLAHLKDISEAD